MSENEENIFNRKELYELYAVGEVKPLDDLMLLEDAALTVKELNKKIQFYKDYKKKKAQDVSDAVQVLLNQIEFYKSVMVSTLKSNKEKSVKFPGSCSISSRNQKAKWRVEDEEEFIAVLKEAQKAGEDVDDVLEKVTQYNVRKREANKLLLVWEQSGKLEGFLKKAKKGIKDIIIKDNAKTTVSISFVEPEDNEEIEDIAIPLKSKDTITTKSKMDDFDSLG